jgi:hypothetical protein
VFFWTTGSANYLYPLIFFIWYLIPVLKLLTKENDPFRKIKNKLLRIIYMGGYIIAGFFLGMGFENLSPILFVFLVVSALYLKYKKIKTPTWILLSIGTVLIGLLTLFFCSGTQNRIEYYREAYQNNSSYISNFLHNIIPVGKEFIRQAALPFIIWMFLIYGLERKHYKKNIIMQSLCVICGILSICIMSVGIYIEPRAYFFATFFLFLPILFAVNYSPKKSWPMLNLITITIVILFMPTISREINNRHHFFIDKNIWTNKAIQAHENYKKGLTSKVVIEPDPTAKYQSKLTYPGTDNYNIYRLKDFLQINENEIYIIDN